MTTPSRRPSTSCSAARTTAPRAMGRSTVDLSLGWLLQPLAVETFLDEVWQTQHWHVQRGCPNYFDRLLHGSSALDELLEAARPQPSAVRLVKGAHKEEPGAYRLADGSVDLVRVRSDFADGYTIIVENLEQYAPAIASLSHSIQVELNFATQVNAYITPPRSQGFAPHWDDHDVLILQMHGSKIWHLYDGADVAPHEMQHRKAVSPTSLPMPTDLLLDAGDLLYLPRGRVHAAEATSKPSIHLTVGIHAPTVLSLVIRALHSLSLRDEWVHDRLPMRRLNDTDARAQVGVLLREVVDTLQRPDVIEEALEALADVMIRRGRCPPVGQISDVTGVDGEALVVK